MDNKTKNKNIAFIVPTLNQAVLQNEDVLQLLVFLAAYISEISNRNIPFSTSVTIISIDPNLSGWRELAPLFPKKILKRITLKSLEEPQTANLAIGSHKLAYNLFEYIKGLHFDEIHSLDVGGSIYYATLSKFLGLRFRDCQFCVHVVGSTIFRSDSNDELLDNIRSLMDDMLERGSVERADTVFIHDRLAWHWYADKIKTNNRQKIIDLSRSDPLTPIPSTERNQSKIETIIFYGNLGTEGGVPAFCDVVDRVPEQLKSQIKILFIGSARGVGGMDAASYIRLRSAKWKCRVDIIHNLSISKEISLIIARQGIVLINTTRKESLRFRLLANLGLDAIWVTSNDDALPPTNWDVTHENPEHIVGILSKKITLNMRKKITDVQNLTDLWKIGRIVPEGFRNNNVSPDLKKIEINAPKVTVCVTHYNRPQKLKTALDSLKRQDYPNFDVIIVDDGSPGIEVKKDLSGIRKDIEHLGWKLLIKENAYLGAARNFAAKHASGDYLLFMDDDNIAKPNEISVFVAVAHRTGADIVTAFADVFREDSEISDTKPPNLRFTPFGSDAALGVFSNCFGDANALYSRDIFDRVGGFTEDFGITHEDWEFFCRASLMNAKMICVPEPLFWYREDSQGMFRSQHTQIHKHSNLRRHIRPYLEMLPHDQAKITRLAQGLMTDLPVKTADTNTRHMTPPINSHKENDNLPFARVAVITRTKDRPLMLRRAIKSVMKQTFKDWLIVVVNDGGDCRIAEMVINQWGDELDGRLLLLNQPVSIGMQSASNFGIFSCDSEFIVIHDDDDTWEPTFLERTVSFLDDHSWNGKIGGVVSRTNLVMEDFDDDGNISIQNKYIYNDQLYAVSLLDMAKENCFPPISFLFYRAALDIIGPFNQKFDVLGDWEFHLRILRSYEIGVIPEPLANYHHRPDTTSGIYGNSVHAHKDAHSSKRAEMLNSIIRSSSKTNGGFPLAQLMAIGDIKHDLEKRQIKEFQHLTDYIWTIEQRIRYISSHFEKRGVSPQSSNLARNGDFRFWTGLGKVKSAHDDSYSYQEICPGFLVTTNGFNPRYKILRNKWFGKDSQLPFGKPYLHIENEADTKHGDWFVLECIIPSSSLMTGVDICISGIGRIRGDQSWINLSGRHNLGDGREVNWPETIVMLSTDFMRWDCHIHVPAVVESEIGKGHGSRILLKLPYDGPFEFDLTDFQVEFGKHPTSFEFNGVFSFKEKMSRFFSKHFLSKEGL